MRPVLVDTTLGLGSPDYRARLLARLIGGIEKDRRGCWMWNRSADTAGNATVFFRNRPRVAHWVAWVLLVGPVAAGVQLDRTCHTAACATRRTCRHLRCVNPQHLTIPAN